jgi:acid stress-induced BolA-like protein IbaG/YrbA
VGLKILGAQDDGVGRMERAIREALPGAEVEVRAGGAGHFELRVVAEAFRDQSRVRQHQLVYGAIAPLLAGEAPPVHAIDRLETSVPQG